MTTKTDNQERAAFEAHFSKPPFEWEAHRYGEDSAWPGNYQNYDMQCAWEAWQARAAVEADRQGRMPSDDEIGELWGECTRAWTRGKTGTLVQQFARALLSRYGNSHVGQPAASVIIDFEQIGSAGPFTVVDGRVSVPAVTVTDLAQRAQPAASAEPVAYLDVGAGGYLDLGSDKSDDELSKLPKGRHMLGIVGTYGANGYASAQVKPDVVELARDGMEVHAYIPNSPEYRVCAELVRVAESAALAAPVAQEPVQVTDVEIEKIVTGLGARWDGSAWKVEDADLHPLVRSLLYRYTSAHVAAQAQPWQKLAAAMYQAAGAYDMPVQVLDALSAAADGEPFAHLIDGLLPVECPGVGAQDREDERQRVGQAINEFMAQYGEDDDPGHCTLDWCDSDNVDALLDAIDAARAAKEES